MIKALKLIGVESNVIALLKSTMIDWLTELVSGKKVLVRQILIKVYFRETLYHLAFHYTTGPFNTSFEMDETRVFIS